MLTTTEQSNIAEPGSMASIEYSDHSLKDSSRFREGSTTKAKTPSVPCANPDDDIPKDDLFICLRPALALGQVFGYFPFGGAITMSADKLPHLT